MFRAIALVALLGGAALCSGCAGHAVWAPQTGLETQMFVEGSAKYELLGETESAASCVYLFNLIPFTEEWPTSYRTNWSMGYFDQAEQLAAYRAIEKCEGADTIIAPRWKSTDKQYLLWRTRTVSLKAKAVRLNE